jgi:integrase
MGRGDGIYLRGKSWIVEMVVKGQRYRESLGPVSRTFAREIAAKRRTELIEGRLRPKAQDPIFEKFMDSYLRDISANKAESSCVRDRTCVIHLKAFFSRKRVSQISRVDVERYRRGRKVAIEAKGKTGMASVNREIAILSNAFNVARFPNPVKGVKRFEEFGRERFLDEEEEERLFEVVNELYPELEPFFRVALNAGYRRGEILALRNDPEMVNFRGGYVRIPRTIRKGKKKDVVTPLNDVLTDALKRAIKGGKIGPGERIFPYSGGGLKNRWYRIRERAGLDGVRIHDLRHTFGSRAGAQAHDDPFALQELMGHTDFKTTQKYIHVSMSRKRALMERLGTESPQKHPHSKRKSRLAVVHQ